MINATDRIAPFFADANLPAAAIAGVRSRRFAGFCLDFVLVSALAGILTVVLGLATFGAIFLVLPSFWPAVAFFYNGSSLSGARMATPGMRLLDLQARALDGAPPTFLAAAVHGVLLYLSWMFPPVFLVTLILPDKRCLHDVAAGLIVVRRPD